MLMQVVHFAQLCTTFVMVFLDEMAFITYLSVWNTTLGSAQETKINQCYEQFQL